MQALVLAAGKGTRMRSDRPKVLHEIFGRPLLDYVLESLSLIGVRTPRVVIGSGADQVRAYLEKKAKRSRIRGVVVLQREQKGTGHAVMVARAAFGAASGDLIVWPGDMPLVRPETIRELLRRHRESQAQVSVLSGLAVNPAGYGRILRAGGSFYAIREELDASEAERRICEVNTGIYIFKLKALLKALEEIRPQNKKQEYYLTDTVEIFSRKGSRIEAFPLASPEEAQGINSRQHLAEAVTIMNQREISRHQEKGVTFISPEQTYVAPDVKIGQDTVIYPWCYIESGVKIGKKCEVGPFAKIRSGTSVGDGSVIGSFVEVNRTTIGDKVMAKHLSYLGDAVIGDETNIGAGTITANFDGRNKHRTKIGRRVQVGSDTVFVAPVHVADDSKTGAGSVLTRGTCVKKGQVFAGVPAKPLK
jgi:bifunctional UDP-N-acetylglucosamine pyrophosphorylase/glucosamine-1-phosphate N-acetyltransferase